MSEISTSKELPVLGFIGLGAMGGPMACNLSKAGYDLYAYDVRSEAVAACVAAGATAVESAEAVAPHSDVVLISLPTSAIFVEVAETVLLSQARPQQIFIDLGTTTAAETRRLATAFAEKGAVLIDAPLSGGSQGAEAGTLHIFIGGDERAVTACRPILEVLGDPDRVVYCGPSGSGQVVKGVNQLAMGLGAAAYLEAVAFGVRAGVDPTAISQAVGGASGWRADVDQITRRVGAGTAEGVYVKFPELPYFLDEAQAQGFELPLTEALFAFCDVAPREWRDNMNRPTVSFWHELLHRGR